MNVFTQDIFNFPILFFPLLTHETLKNLSPYMYITYDTEISVSLLYLHQFCCALSLTGHSDWVRDVQFVRENGGDTLLASCSQDISIRLWRITQQPQEQQQEEEEEEEHQQEGEERELKLKANIFTVERGMTFAVT